MSKQKNDFKLPDSFKDEGIKMALSEKAREVLDYLKKQKNTDEIHLLNVPEKTSDLEEIIEISEAIIKNFKKVVVLGTGGSTLSGQTWVNFASNPKIKVEFIDNIDPHTVELFFAKTDIASTLFLAISKSGGTVETLSLVITVLNEFAEKKIDPSNNFMFITNEYESPIAKIAKKISSRIIKHDNVGGRFSILSNVGLIPAYLAGLDIYKIREGAKIIIDEVFIEGKTNIADNVITAILLEKEGFNLSVFMPYIDRLSSFANWYRQIIAESLGKDGHGPTPIKAMGTLDQHSQLQLYLDGPIDKYFTFIEYTQNLKGRKLANNLEISELEYLKNKTLGDVIAAEQQATISTLKTKNFPVRCIEVQNLDESAIGYLIMLFTLETIIHAMLLDLNPFDQPAVEESKILTREILLLNN